MIHSKLISDGRKQKSPVIFFILFILAVSLIFSDAVAAIIKSWQQDEYSHGYLIPVIALVLLLNKMTDAGIAPQNSWLGFAILSFCIAIHLFLEVTGIRGILPQVYMLSIIGVFILFL